MQERPGAKPLGQVSGHVVFRDVDFGYDRLSPVLSGIDIDARPGQVIALLGPTGSREVHRRQPHPPLLRCHRRLASRSTASTSATSRWSRCVTNIGIVQQDVFLFIGTIRDNIAYGRPDATQEEVERAARAARIHDFIVSLPYGYDEWVGERGVTLSGGQKQRIAIARTLLLDPRSSSSMTPPPAWTTQTEFLIQQALQELMTGRTTFVIAQRLRTVMRADEILVLRATAGSSSAAGTPPSCSRKGCTAASMTSN